MATEPYLVITSPGGTRRLFIQLKKPDADAEWLEILGRLAHRAGLTTESGGRREDPLGNITILPMSATAYAVAPAPAVEVEPGETSDSIEWGAVYDKMLEIIAVATFGEVTAPPRMLDFLRLVITVWALLALGRIVLSRTD